MGATELCFFAAAVVTPFAMTAPAVELKRNVEKGDIHVPSLSRFGLQVVVDSKDRNSEIASAVGGRYVTLEWPEGKASAGAASLTVRADREPEHNFFLNGAKRLGFTSSGRRTPSPHDAQLLVLQTQVVEDRATHSLPGARFAVEGSYRNSRQVFSRPTVSFGRSALSMKMLVGPNVPAIFQGGRWFMYRAAGEGDERFHLAYVGKERDLTGFQGVYVDLRYMPLRK